MQGEATVIEIPYNIADNVRVIVGGKIKLDQNTAGELVLVRFLREALEKRMGDRNDKQIKTVRPEVGDRVRIRFNYGHPFAGKEGIVEDLEQRGMGGTYAKIMLDGGGLTYAHISVFEILSKENPK